MPIYEEKKLRNGKKQYFIKAYVKYDDGTRKQITRRNKEWLGLEGKREASRVESELTSNVQKSKKTKEKEKKQDIYKNITVNQLYSQKNEHDILYNKNSKSTRITYDQRFYKYVSPHFGEKCFVDLTNDNVLNLIGILKNTTNNRNSNKKLSESYINSIIQLLKNTYEFGIKKYNIINILNPFATYEPLKKNRDSIPIVSLNDLIKSSTTISPDEWKRFSVAIEEQIKISDNQEKRTLEMLALFFSVEYILLNRVGETQGMKYKNFIFDSNLYILYEAYNKRLNDLSPLKNRKARILYIPPTLCQKFKDLYEREKQREDFNDDEFIFKSLIQPEKPISRSTIARYREKICKAAGINYITNHELRHAGISNAIHNEVDVSALSDMAGHNKQIMFNTYTQTLKQSNEQLVDVLNQIYIPSVI